MKPQKHLIRLTTIFIVSLLWGSEVDFRFKTINTRDGLSDNEITSISDDGRGILLLGPKEGRNRYDG